ncbi:unnamed protein product, partial [Auanema sp. JU1783]
MFKVENNTAPDEELDQPSIEEPVGTRTRNKLRHREVKEVSAQEEGSGASQIVKKEAQDYPRERSPTSPQDSTDSDYIPSKVRQFSKKTLPSKSSKPQNISSPIKDTAPSKSPVLKSPTVNPPNPKSSTPKAPPAQSTSKAPPVKTTPKAPPTRKNKRQHRNFDKTLNPQNPHRNDSSPKRFKGISHFISEVLRSSPSTELIEIVRNLKNRKSLSERDSLTPLATSTPQREMANSGPEIVEVPPPGAGKNNVIRAAGNPLCPKYKGTSSFKEFIRKFALFANSAGLVIPERLAILPLLLEAPEAETAYFDIPETIRKQGPWNVLIEQLQERLLTDLERDDALLALQNTSQNELSVAAYARLLESLSLDAFLPNDPSKPNIMKITFIRGLRNNLKQAVLRSEAK